MAEEQGVFKKSDIGMTAERVIDPNGKQTRVIVEERSSGDVYVRRLRGGRAEFYRSLGTDASDNTALFVGSISDLGMDRDAQSPMKLTVDARLTSAITDAVARASGNKDLSIQEARQFDNLRAYIANHSGDGVLDAREQNIAIQRANNIAPVKSK